MKNQISLLIFSAQKNNRQHVQILLTLIALGMLVLGLGAPSDGSGGGIR